MFDGVYASLFIVVSNKMGNNIWYPVFSVPIKDQQSLASVANKFMHPQLDELQLQFSTGKAPVIDCCQFSSWLLDKQTMQLTDSAITSTTCNHF